MVKKMNGLMFNLNQELKSFIYYKVAKQYMVI